VTVDGSNGVGAMKVKELQAYLGDMLTVNPVFDGSTGVLNYQVDYGVIFSTLLQIFITQSSTRVFI